MQSIEAAEPADCHAHALRLTASIEHLRRDLGRPVDGRPPVAASGASPRECWFQALAVHRKAARLAAEWGVDASAPVAHPPPLDKLRPGHVLQVIDAALRLVDEVDRGFGHAAAATAPAREATRTPSDVLGVLATASRQLDRLLARPISPGEVYAQVTAALAYATRLTGADALAVPAFEPGKFPADCHARLREAFDKTRALIKRAGHPVLDQVPGDVATCTPSDCFDLATLVLGEVAFLHALKPDANPPALYEVVAGGRKLPSHVYQLAGALTAQLDRLAR